MLFTLSFFFYYTKMQKTQHLYGTGFHFTNIVFVLQCSPEGRSFCLFLVLEGKIKVSKNRKVIQMPRLLPLLLSISLYLLPVAAFTHSEKPQDANKLTERLKRLEPDVPQDISNPPFFHLPYPSIVKPPQEIIRSARKLPYKVVLDKSDWQRP
ncbi:hypothetical protein [Paenibacillus sp. GP183]|uniref:hypothetical protein n=1 Tax=Paenibacillus sp. GP183 TaxID=1882751 RepID=UPI000B87C98B|nr:hypothetical protein [Paenibacillus sp. GP183]